MTDNTTNRVQVFYSFVVYAQRADNTLDTNIVAIGEGVATMHVGNWDDARDLLRNHIVDSKVDIKGGFAVYLKSFTPLPMLGSYDDYEQIK